MIHVFHDSIVSTDITDISHHINSTKFIMIHKKSQYLALINKNVRSREGNSQDRISTVQLDTLENIHTLN